MESSDPAENRATSCSESTQTQFPLEIPFPEHTRPEKPDENYQKILQKASQWNEERIPERHQRWAEYWTEYYFGSEQGRRQTAKAMPLFFAEPMTEEYPNGDLGAPYTRAMDPSDLEAMQQKQAKVQKK